MLDELEDLEKSYEAEHRHGREFVLSVRYAARATLIRSIYEAPETEEISFKAIADLKLTVTGSYVLAFRLRRYFIPNAEGVPCVFDQWVNDISASHTEDARPVAGVVDRLEGEIGDFLSKERLKWGDCNDVPLVVAIDYARDIGGG